MERRAAGSATVGCGPRPYSSVPPRIGRGHPAGICLLGGSIQSFICRRRGASFETHQGACEDTTPAAAAQAVAAGAGDVGARHGGGAGGGLERARPCRRFPCFCARLPGADEGLPGGAAGGRDSPPCGRALRGMLAIAGGRRWLRGHGRNPGSPSRPAPGVAALLSPTRAGGFGRYRASFQWGGPGAARLLHTLSDDSGRANRYDPVMLFFRKERT